jgi:hypothetical protein
VAGIDIKSGFNICPLDRYKNTSEGYILGYDKKLVLDKLCISDIFDRLNLIDRVP